MKVLTAFFLLALLTGCIKSRMYVAPTHGDLVKITVKNLAQDDSTQGISVFEDDYDCYEVSHINYFNKMDFSKDILFKFRKNYTVIYSQRYTKQKGNYSGENYSCSRIFTFPIKKGFSYLFASNHDDDKCYLSVMEKPVQDDENDMNKWSKVDLISRNLIVPVFNAGPWCKADERFKGSSSLAIPRGLEKK